MCGGLFNQRDYPRKIGRAFIGFEMIELRVFNAFSLCVVQGAKSSKYTAMADN